MPTTECQLQLENGVLHLRGVLDKNSVPAAYQCSQQLLRRKQAPDTIELGAVEHIDSAGLALLLEWQSWANHSEHKLRLEHAPQQLLQLARLSELDRILNLE
jgi:anti-anti-sigma factor